jgi:hypothetical protein
LEKDRQNATQTMIAARAIVKWVGHKLYMDNVFPFCIDLMTCIQELPIVMELSEFGYKTPKLKQGDITC